MRVFPPLSELAIRAQLSAGSVQALQQLSLLDEVGSTNAFLLQLPASELHAHALLAEQQIAGRGRRGKSWQSPPGSNIYLSLGWIFESTARDLSCLSLVAGVAAVRALESLGIVGAGLKWPNDIHADGRKLGGILLESRAASGGRAAVVMGIGINVAMPLDEVSAQAIDQPWTSVTRLPGVEPVSDLRDRLAGAVLEQLLTSLNTFEDAGFQVFRDDWSRLDILLNQPVVAKTAEGEIYGQAIGIDGQGNLQVAEQLPAGQEQVHSFNSAEVSVRRTDPANKK
ncbi:MAG TPA: biotin--[acetyl-CoA-carboxylase] ligase [Xanthomonadales bacterium]|nr:biotin--[acetyl-CoA-carboxylase] ligase [Xanthomonadales bacterium]